MVTRAAFLAITPVLLASCDFLDRGPDIHFILLNGFHGEIRIEQGVADASDPRAFSSNGRELPVLSGHAEQPDVVALRALGMFDSASNNLRPYTEVYVFGTWHDVDDLLNRYHENFEKVTPAPQSPSNQTMKPTAPFRYNPSVFATTPRRGLSLSR